MEGDQECELLTSLVKIYLAQLESAMKISEIISEHGEEEEMSPDAFVTGLIYRLMTSMSEEEMKEALKFAEDCLNKECSSSSSDEEEKEEKKEEEKEEKEEIILSRTIKRNTCNCDICVKARVCLSNYPTYEIKDALAEKFKDAIDNICKIHKFNI